MKTATRVQTGLRLETRLLNTMKALAEISGYFGGRTGRRHGVARFEGKAPFSDESLGKIETLRAVYGLDLTAADNYRLMEDPQ
ncbi:hypothetical protein [Leisingera sp. F5]|uniref:hypothetical protein n=1 Tax=Leisingera sp. F5 TaxID=1813816 RepID=UPI000ACD1F22|nr:hypothetical protein [Leisingera sp. F5]